MAKKSGTLSKVWSFLAWLVGVLVSLAVGHGMISKTLTVPYLVTLSVAAGWAIVILTLVGVVLVIIDALIL
ncbi:MAG: hypothetical protein ABIH72_05670 [archaeon]